MIFKIYFTVLFLLPSLMEKLLADLAYNKTEYLECLPNYKAQLMRCISTCLGLKNTSQTCFYENKIQTPTTKKLECPEFDCNSNTALTLKRPLTIIKEGLRAASHKKICGKRYYMSMTELSYENAIHLCPCFAERTKLAPLDTVEKVKCLMGNLPDPHRRKGLVLTSGYRSLSPNFKWCGGKVNNNLSSEMESMIEKSKEKFEETCIVLSFKPYGFHELPPDDFVLKEVNCRNGTFFYICEGID
ncbi:uncharacterized protein LOC132197466 [Neocloeon triangulifer]|uniref:uncharacterized protein LOC132197466 n=1 Tax=Neocloeon triangulifer TaxID=2078957 RepID=UPI00286F644D|nr:uncharacterized protein LOC132197466 [Neocloeon triangulifer]